MSSMAASQKLGELLSARAWLIILARSLLDKLKHTKFGHTEEDLLPD
jgi:hypothetical protein